MDINRVRYFNVFADTGSLVRASEVLRISQPALSKALKLLEAETGLKLVEADGRGLKLTSAGKRFRDRTKPLLSEWASVAERVQRLDEAEPTRIASFEVFSTYFLSRLLQYAELAGLEMLEMAPGRMEQAVAEGRSDLAITYVPVPRAGVDFIEVAKIRMGVFGAPLLKNETWESLPFVVPVQPLEGTPSKVVGLDGWPDHRFKRTIRYRVTLMESAMELCREGRAVAYLPEFVISLHNRRLMPEFRLTEFKAPVPAVERIQAVYLVRRQGAAETKLERQVAKSLRSLK